MCNGDLQEYSVQIYSFSDVLECRWEGGGGITPICTVFGLSLNVTLVIDFELG